MAIRDIFKVSRKTFINPSGWFGLDSFVEQNKTIWDTIRSLFSPAKPLREETFEQAMQRMHLTEADLQNSAKNYRLFALVFVLFGLLLFLYAFYLLFTHSSYTGLLLAIAASAVFFSQAFKYDFWAFQIKRRKLGVTFAEWKANILGIKGKSS